jgi:glycosyltransferase involved in cell wall biosynthesis
VNRPGGEKAPDAGGAGASERRVRVSALVMTYNHADKIRQAIESVLAQETDFEFEIVITEDCSTDGTREIVEDYRRRFPERIRLLLSEKNRNSLAVISRGLRACRGEFVALLDGDDYWTDPEKLERQVTFLDAHPECSSCFHNALAVYEDGSRESHPWTPPDQKPFLTLEDIWRGNPIATGSTVFRNGLYEMPAWYDDMPITDWPLHVLNAENGPIGYLDRVMSVYRIHSGGVYSALDERTRFERRYQFYVQMNRNMRYRCDALARHGLFSYFLEWAEEFQRRGDRAGAAFCARKCLAGRPKKKSGYRRLLRVVGWLVWKSWRIPRPAAVSSR